MTLGIIISLAGAALCAGVSYALLKSPRQGSRLLLGCHPTVVSDDPAIHKADLSGAAARHVLIMGGYEEAGAGVAVHALQQFHHMVGGFAVEIAGGFVRQH